MATYDIKSAPHELDAPTQKNDEAGDVSPVQRSLKGMDYQSAVAALSRTTRTARPRRSSRALSAPTRPGVRGARHRVRGAQ